MRARVKLDSASQVRSGGRTRRRRKRRTRGDMRNAVTDRRGLFKHPAKFIHPQLYSNNTDRGGQRRRPAEGGVQRVLRKGACPPRPSFSSSFPGTVENKGPISPPPSAIHLAHIHLLAGGGEEGGGEGQSLTSSRVKDTE